MIIKSIIFVLSIVFSVSNSFANEANSFGIATYKDHGGETKEITEEMMMKEFHSLFESQEMKNKTFSNLEPELQKNLIIRYVTNRILDDKVRSLEIKKSKAFKERFASISEMLSAEVARSMAMSDAIKNSVTQDAIDEQYNKISQELKGKQSIVLSHILLADKKSSEDVMGKINKGMSFSDAAKKYSKDESTKNKSGSLGKLHPGDIDKALEDAAYAMKPGQVSKKPIKTQYGWHILRLEDIQDVKIPSKEELEPRIRTVILNQAQGEYWKEIIKKSDLKITLQSQPKK